MVLKVVIREKGSHRSKISDRGKIPEDEQYTDPDIENLKNRFSASFSTSLKTKLTDSILFKDRAKIVHTWHHVMNPGSMWDFKITHHYGRGIHMNYLYDIENINPENCVGYFLVVEQVGDSRATIIRKSDKDKFDGYWPSSLRYSFEHAITYLGVEDDDADFESDAKPSVYKVKRREDDFAENSEFSKIFTPDREATFNIDYDKIQLLEHQSNEEISEKKFLLEYNNAVIPSFAELENLKEKYGNIGLEVDLDDLGRNINKPPSESDYEGTEGQKLGDILDFDNEI